MRRLLLVLLVTVSFSATAQFRPYRDVVYLNDSTIIRGNIRFGEPDSTLFVDTQFGCTFAYTKDQVLRYEFKEHIPYKEREKGLSLCSSLSAGTLLYPVIFQCASADMTIGLIYQICSWYAVGLDFCYGFYFNTDELINAPMVLLDQRFFLSKKPICPYLNLRTGCSFGHQGMLPPIYSIYFYDQGYKDWGWSGELGFGVATQNIDITLCTSILPFEREYDRLLGLSIRLGYSFPLN